MLIKNGLLVDHATSQLADIYIEDGVIQEIGILEKDCPIIDATNMTVMPAFVDLHVHLRDPGFTYKEDLVSGSAAAVAGGYTTVNLMANTKPIISTLADAKDVVERMAEIGICDAYQCMSFTRSFDGKDLSHLNELEMDQEQQFIKFISDDGFGIRHGGIFYQGLEKCTELDRIVMIHAEDHDFSAIDMGMAEDLETARDCYVAEKVNGKIHFCHVSTKFSAETIIAAKQRGVPVTFEVTPHHLALTNDVTYKVHPPLRTEEDRQFLIDCIRNNWVDAIATDHAPHSVEDKEKGSPGMVGLETAFSVCYTALVKKEGIPMQKLSALMSKIPANLMRINKGEIAVGVTADLVIVDTEQEIVIQSDALHSKSKNTPFDGQKYFGKVIKTIKAGEIVFSRTL